MPKRKEYTIAEKIKWCEENMQYSLDKINYHQKRYNRFKKILDGFLNREQEAPEPLPNPSPKEEPKKSKRFSNLELEED